MGVLWHARDELLGRDVAIKELRAPVDADGTRHDAARERGLREARAAARVTHPSAVTIYDVVEEDGRPWIVMELLPSRTLADVVAHDGPLQPSVVARIGLDLLDALTAAHDVGVLHRDVKPSNVLFADGRAVLVDFGIATLDGDSSITLTGQLLGSPAFMAPERARGEEPTPASDLWSLGATLFTAVEGDAPFRRDGHLPTLAAVVTQEAPPAAHAGSLRPLIAGLLARDPGTRPNAAATRAALLDVLTPDAEVRPPTEVAGSAEEADPYEDGEPTVEAPGLLDDDTTDHERSDPDPTADASPVPPVAAVADAFRDEDVRTIAVRLPLVPRPRRAGAVAAAVLAPVTLFALAMGWPSRSANPLVQSPRAVITTPARTTTTATPVPSHTAAPTRPTATVKGVTTAYEIKPRRAAHHSGHGHGAANGKGAEKDRSDKKADKKPGKADKKADKGSGKKPGT
jgi:hypothetical protein